MSTVGKLKLKRKLIKDEREIRLVNWGRWSRKDSTMSTLGYPSWASIMQEYLGNGTKGLAVAEIDAQHLEYVISTLNMTGRNGFGWGELYAFCLKVEYIDKPENAQQPVSVRAKHVSRYFNRPCAERTYQHHLQFAREAVFTYAQPL